jgi:bifunctional non-homologous end joining protein LigD
VAQARNRRSNAAALACESLLKPACARQALAAEGAVVFAHACKLGLEGIVSKRVGSLYRSGKSRNWLKTKNPDFVRT